MKTLCLIVLLVVSSLAGCAALNVNRDTTAEPLVVWRTDTVVRYADTLTRRWDMTGSDTLTITADSIRGRVTGKYQSPGVSHHIVITDAAGRQHDVVVPYKFWIVVTLGKQAAMRIVERLETARPVIVTGGDAADEGAP